MTIFTRVHYEWLASTLKSMRRAWTEDDVDDLVDEFSDRLKQDNPNFDKSSFRKGNRTNYNSNRTSK